MKKFFITEVLHIALMACFGLIACTVINLSARKSFLQVETQNCYTAKRDTIFIQAYGPLCITTYVDDPHPKLAEPSGRWFTDSTCSFRVLRSSPTRFEH